jgi:alkanesulfonate monooxygenase SsuD/methylene tetrahydromethanopterin reductase-like flavin-dependent oxidoreductase (luciferase family)
MKVGVALPVADSDAPGGRALGWDEIRDVALATEAAGLDSGWLADHLLHRNDAGEIVGLHDGWTLLSSLAALTSRIQLGTLVLCASFRNAGLVANMATTLDLVSDGRLVLGLGAGWHKPEYDAYGYPFDHRVGRFAEHLEIVARLVRGERFTFEGQYSQVHDAALAPPPQHRIPILVAAEGPRMLGLAARWADAWITAWYARVSDELRTTLRAFDAALREAGRPADEVERVVGITVRDPDQPPVAEPEDAIEGSIDDVARALDAYRELGIAQVVVGLEPINVRSVERLAAAVRLHRGASASFG